jgi:superfamily II DNA helicase RecQ
LDIPDIDQVVQFMVTTTLNEWIQHYGRAGRGGQPATAILLLEPSAFQIQKKKSKRKGKHKCKAVKSKVNEPILPQKRTCNDIEPEDEDGESSGDKSAASSNGE